MPNIPAGVSKLMRASGGLAPISLLELQMASGDRLFLSDAQISLLSLIGAFDLGGAPLVQFQDRLTTPPEWEFTGTLVTSTARAGFENVSGDTVRRAGSLSVSREQLWGALFVYRLWKIEAEYALITVNGRVTDVTVTDDEIELELANSSNWSEIQAPNCNINENCQNTFGSMQCGSTAGAPCANTYDTCTQKNRFKGVVKIWDNGQRFIPGDTRGLAQPSPLVDINLRRPA